MTKFLFVIPLVSGVIETLSSAIGYNKITAKCVEKIINR